jgi:hypothetical protein
MLCRENPPAMRIRPSQGDGGIDVITVTPAGWKVDQIKYFSASLTDRQKAQVRGSFQRLRAYAASQGADIAEWHLVVPVDPTNEERIWFDGLTAGAGYPCAWHGLTHVEGLAAKYPDVIDYYLRDGRERLETLVGQLTDVIRLGYKLPSNGEWRPLAPSEVESGLAGLYAALNASDPHYRYSFSVDADFPEVHDEPFLVAAKMKKTDIACVTIRIYARFAEAEQERPAPGSMRFSFADDSAEAEALRGHYDFGAPATVKDSDGDKIGWSVDLPGGLGGTFRGGTFTLGPAHTDDAQPYRFRIQILDPDGQEISVCGLQMEPVTTGISGVGVRANGVEDHSVFRLEIRINTVTQVVNMNIATFDLTGRHPVDVLPGLRVAAAFHPPNLLRFAAPYGPMTGPVDPVPGPLDLDLGLVLRLVEALAVIQEHTTEQIMSPDFTTVTRGAAGGLVQLADILRDGSITVEWNGLEMVAPVAPAPLGIPPAPMSIRRQCTLQLNGVEIVLGSLRHDLASARVESVTPADDGLVRVRIVPGDDPTATLVYEPPEPG